MRVLCACCVPGYFSQEAEELLEEVLQAQTEVLGKTHIHTLGTKYNKGLVVANTGLQQRSEVHMAIACVPTSLQLHACTRQPSTR